MKYGLTKENLRWKRFWMYYFPVLNKYGRPPHKGTAEHDNYKDCLRRFHNEQFYFNK